MIQGKNTNYSLLKKYKGEETIFFNKTMAEGTKKGSRLLIKYLHKIHTVTMVT
jgi:hypothetical protein